MIFTIYIVQMILFFNSEALKFLLYIIFITIIYINVCMCARMYIVFVLEFGKVFRLC